MEFVIWVETSPNFHIRRSEALGGQSWLPLGSRINGVEDPHRFCGALKIMQWKFCDRRPAATQQ
jgi:hypothetical protein